MVWTTKHVCVARAIWIYLQDRKYIYWIESKHRRNYAARLFSSLPQTLSMFPKCPWFFSNVLDCSRYALRDHFLTFVSRFILHQGSLYDNVWQFWNFWYLWVPHLPVIGKTNTMSTNTMQIQCLTNTMSGFRFLRPSIARTRWRRFGSVYLIGKREKSTLRYLFSPKR